MLAEILGSATRARVLEVLMDATAPMTLRELVRRVGSGTSGVQRDAARFEGIGLVRSERQGNVRLLALDRSHPLYPELRALVLKAAVAKAAEGEAVGLNPSVRPVVRKIVAACKRHHVARVSLFGSSTQPQADVVPNDLDILIRFEEDTPDRFDAYFDLKEELERIMGMPVDIVEEGAIRNPYFRDEVDRTKVVVYEAA